MNIFTELPKQEQEEILRAVAKKSNIELSVLEKDFWVCWTLQKLSEIEELRNNLIFKGGTSLSKAYNLISRFSEDIDLVLKQSYLELSEQVKNNPNTNTQQKRILKKCERKIRDDIFPLIKQTLVKNSNKITEKSVILDNTDPKKRTILFYYPSVFEGYAYKYIKPIIKLEFEPRSLNTPATHKIITPYLKRHAPLLFKNGNDILFNTIDLNRTFWEKITVLHRVASLPKEKQTPRRYSRHYYDIYMFIAQGKHLEAVNYKHFLQEIVENDSKFFRRGHVDYNNLKIGNIRLIPEDEKKIEELREDYVNMKEMFFNDVPEFDKIIEELGKLEKIINKI